MRISRAFACVATVMSLGLAACATGGGAASSPASAPGSSPPASIAPASASTAASAPGSGAASGSASAQPAASGGGAAQTAKIGAAFSLTGPGGPYGPGQKNAALLAQDEINKAGVVKLAIDVEDDASDKTQGINVFQKFIKDNDVAILGPTLSTLAFAADPEAVKAKVPVLGVSNTADGITQMGDYVFRDSLSEAQVIPNTIKVAKSAYNLKKAAIIYANDGAFEKSGYDVFKKALTDNGIDITDTETYSEKDTDFTAQLTKIKGTNPDALILSSLADNAANIITQAHKLGFPAATHYIGGNGLNSPQVAKIAGKDAEGVLVGAAWISSSTNPLSQQFVKDYQAKYNQPPDQFAAQSYAGVYILADAIKRAKLTGDTAKDREALREALAQTKDVPTVLGNFSFTPQRDANHTPVVQTIKNGQFVLFQP